MARIKLTLAGLLLLVGNSLAGVQFSVGVESDMSRPTFGLQGPSSSYMSYDEKNGLNMKGTVNDILGPPIKIANGFNQMFKGSSMSGIGSSLQANGAVLNLDSKLLEAAGGASMLKGGLLLGGSAAKVGAAKVVAGAPGKKIASIIELPVKVVALKDIAAGGLLKKMSQMDGQEAETDKVKGAEMIKQGDAMKAQGMNQVIQGATEGVQNIGNMIQQTAGNAATAFRLLPIMLDTPPQQQQQQQLLPSQQQHETSRQGSTSLTGGSLFGGLSSMMSGQMRSTDAVSGLFSGQNGAKIGNGLAAIVNASHPLTDILLNPSINPLLLPLSAGNSPLAQGIANKQPLGLSGASSAGPQHYPTSSFSFNLFPGLKVKETSSSQFPSLFKSQNEPTQHIEQQQQVTKS